MRRTDEMGADGDFVESGQLKPPGPVGRLIRLILGLVCGWFVLALTLAGPEKIVAQFPYIGGLWLWGIAALYFFSYVINIGFGRSWGRWPQLVIIVCALAASITSYVTYNSFWGPPLAWFIIVWLTYVYAHLAVSFILAAILATPGCEMRALPQLVAIVGGRPLMVHHCPVGPLSRVDAWEARRRFGDRNER